MSFVAFKRAAVWAPFRVSLKHQGHILAYGPNKPKVYTGTNALETGTCLKTLHALEPESMMAAQHGRTFDS